MQFRPCIDIHNGKVKQIVGSSLKDQGSVAKENFVSGQDAAFYANLYKKQGITGGHIILLNPQGSEYYEATKDQALKALKAYPGGLQVGGGITSENAAEFIEAGAAAVIVTSYVFKDGTVNYENLDKIYQLLSNELENNQVIIASIYKNKFIKATELIELNENDKIFGIPNSDFLMKESNNLNL